MMGGLSVDATLMESLTPEPFTNVIYFWHYSEDTQY